jgi:hypothetical protein
MNQTWYQKATESNPLYYSLEKKDIFPISLPPKLGEQPS